MFSSFCFQLPENPTSSLFTKEAGKLPVKFFFFLMVYISLLVPWSIPYFCWELFFPSGSETKAGAEDHLDILEDFPCLPHSGSVHFEMVHGDNGPSDTGMFSTAKRQEGGKLCAGIVHCTRLAASSCRTAAAALGSSQGQRAEIQGWYKGWDISTGHRGARLNKDKSCVVLNDGVKDRGIMGHMAVIFDW